MDNNANQLALFDPFSSMSFLSAHKLLLDGLIDNPGKYQKSEFSRKDYMNVFRNLSSATASRDLKKGVELNLFTRIGDKNKTSYKIASGHSMPINRNKTSI